MVTAARIVLFEADTQEQLDWQLQHSLPHGEHRQPGTVTVLAVDVPTDEEPHIRTLAERFAHTRPATTGNLLTDTPEKPK